ncbi:MAG TPA: DUF3263 domain-containing protein [Actinocrinis sp.]|nr:DUF3263 domain-containing protein [Actinocrinis sp.]
MTSRTLRERVSDAVSGDVGSEQPEPPETFIPNQSEATSEREFPEQRRQPAEPGAVTEVTDAPPEVASDVAVAAPVATAAQPRVRPLSERDRAVLTFEKQYWKYSGAKEQAIRDRFEMSATRYYQVLNALLDRPEAQEFEPMLVKRLRRQRAARQRSRSARVLR